MSSMVRKKKRGIKHIGFKAAAAKAQAQYPGEKGAGGRVIGYAKAHASAAAKAANPRLLRTRGSK